MGQETPYKEISEVHQRPGYKKDWEIAKIPAGFSRCFHTENLYRMFFMKILPIKLLIRFSLILACILISEQAFARYIGNFVWHDKNGNGIQDDGLDSGMNGVTVEIYDCNTGLLLETQQTVTEKGAPGYFMFYFYRDVEVYLKVVPPSGYTFTQANRGTDDLADSDFDPANGKTACVTLACADESEYPFCKKPYYDAGLVLIPANSPGTGTPGYWKNHPEAWPVNSVVLGITAYTKEQAIALMNKPTKNDKTLNLVEHLIAAKLNVIAGNESGCISASISDADAFLMVFPPGSNVKAGSSAWGTISLEFSLLDQYNNGLLCAPHRD